VRTHEALQLRLRLNYGIIMTFRNVGAHIRDQLQHAVRTKQNSAQRLGESNIGKRLERPQLRVTLGKLPDTRRARPPRRHQGLHPMG
jgi:hypothetical protein